MDFLVHVTKRVIQIMLASILGIAFISSNAFALGDLSFLYVFAFNYSAYFLVIIAIFAKLKYGERLKSICLFIICVISEWVIFANVPYSRFKFFIMIFSLINLILLIIYVWLQIKSAAKNRRNTDVKN